MAAPTNVTINDYLLPCTTGTQGIIICLTNGLLLLAILHQRSFRQRTELMIIAGMAGIDAFYGFGAMVLGFYRVYILLQGRQNDLITEWQCMLPTFMNNLGLQMSSVMTVAVSCDRFMAIVWPTKYRKLDERYTKTVMAVVALFGISTLVAMLLSTYFDATTHLPIINKLCGRPAASATYNLYQPTLVAGAGCISVAIYICVFIYYRRTMHQISPYTLNRADQRAQKAIVQQRRLTVTLGIITVSTCFLFIIPFSIIAVYTLMYDILPQAALFGTISRFSTIANVAIYVYRQEEMKKEIRALFKCKKEDITTLFSRPIVPQINETAAVVS